MIALVGMYFQDGLTGSARSVWALFTGSPLMTFVNDPGVRTPVGSWDHLRFIADGNVASFERRRSVDVKHSRAFMVDAMAAISMVPALVWAQVIAYSGFGKFVGCFADYNFAFSRIRRMEGALVRRHG